MSRIDAWAFVAMDILKAIWFCLPYLVLYIVGFVLGEQSAKKERLMS